MRIGISIVPSAARYQSRLGEKGRGVLGYTRPFRQSGLVLSPFPSDLIGLNGCSIYPSSRVPNLAKRSLLFVLSPFSTDLIGLNGCSIFPSSSVPNLAKRSLLFVSPHHFTFLHSQNILVRQKFVLLHFFNYNLTFSI